MAKLYGVFQSTASANAAISEMQFASRRHGNSGLSGLMVGDSIMEHGGSVFVRSTSGKEQFLYQNDQYIMDCDREYLDRREAIVWALNHIVPRDTWAQVPRAHDETIDKLFSSLRRLKFFRKAQAADAKQRKWRYSFLYVNAGGLPGDPIESGGSMWHGFSVISPWNIDWDKTVFNRGDPSLPYGIETLWVKQAATKDRAGVEMGIHGTRLIAFIEDVEADDPRKARAKLDHIYDPLQEYRDIKFGQKQGQLEGNPIVIEVDTESDQIGRTLKDDEAQAMQDEATEVRSGWRDAFGPLENTKVSRLGSAGLDNAEWALRASIGGIAVGTEFTANQLMVFSRGSEQITDSDRLDYGDQLMLRCEDFCWDIMNRVVELANRSGFMRKAAGVRANSRVTPELPVYLEWPRIRRLDEHQQSLTDFNRAKTIGSALTAGYLLEPRLMKHLVKNTEPIDPALILPQQPQWRINDDEEWDGPSGGDDPNTRKAGSRPGGGN